MPKSPIYLDYCASTPLDPLVLEEMMPYLTSAFGNPSSSHRLGRQAKRAVEEARERVARLVGSDPGEVVFTSGATEAMNLVLRGFADQRGRAALLRSSTIEHKAVIGTLRALESQGCRVDLVAPGSNGEVRAEEFVRDPGAEQSLVAVMWVNNETGVVQPIAKIASACRDRGYYFVTDATQAVGHLPVDFAGLGIDGLAMSGHKIHGPKGVGALVASARLKAAIKPQMTGGGQEAGMRAGSLNVPGVVGLGAACDLVRKRLAEDAAHARSLIALFEAGLMRRITGVSIRGEAAERAPHCTCIGLDGVEGDALVANLNDVMISTGSACNSMVPTPSHVLLAMGCSEEEAYSSVRVSVSRITTTSEIEHATAAIAEAVTRLRALR